MFNIIQNELVNNEDNLLIKKFKQNGTYSTFKLNFYLNFTPIAILPKAG